MKAAVFPIPKRKREPSCLNRIAAATGEWQIDTSLDIEL